MKQFIFTVEEDNENRVDKFLNEKMSDVSRSFLQKLIKSKDVKVNNVAIKSNFIVKEGDIVEIDMPDSVIPDIVAEDIPLDILFEDEDLIIVNKPKGMVVHPAAGHYTGTLVNAIMYHCNDSLSGINGVMRPGIVHRIDMDTTGSIIVCKNDSSHQYIAELLKEHNVTRKYHAIVHGVMDEEEGTIEGPIGRHPIERKKMCINTKNGKPAITHYKVLKRFDQYSYIECELETGRTHQIRVHMASKNHPLLGDEVYCNRTSKFKLQGQTLHAKTIGFIHPSTKEYIEIDAPLPEYFENLLRIL